MLIQSFIFWLKEVFGSTVSPGHDIVTPDYEFLQMNMVLFIMFTGEKKKTKAVDNDLNPVWNEVSGELKCKVWELQYVDLFIGKWLVTWELLLPHCMLVTVSSF